MILSAAVTPSRLPVHCGTGRPVRRAVASLQSPQPISTRRLHLSQMQQPTQRAARVAQATSGGSSGTGGSPEEQSLLVQVVATPFYRTWVQLGVVLVLFMIVDAGFSGDWSRIEVITKEQEAAARQFAIYVGCFHLLCGSIAAAVSSRRGEAWAPRVAKVLAVGFLALVEVLVLPEEGVQPGRGA